MGQGETLFFRTISLAILVSIVAFIYVDSMLKSVYVFISISLFSTFLWIVRKWPIVIDKMDMNSARILSWIVFTGGFVGMAFLGKGLNIPITSGLIVSFFVTLCLWWTYYSLEPARS